MPTNTPDHGPARRQEEAGFSTAELLGNAALGIVALLVIWGALQALGVDIVEWITALLQGSIQNQQPLPGPT